MGRHMSTLLRHSRYQLFSYSRSTTLKFIKFGDLGSYSYHRKHYIYLHLVKIFKNGSSGKGTDCFDINI